MSSNLCVFTNKIDLHTVPGAFVLVAMLLVNIAASYVIDFRVWFTPLVRDSASCWCRFLEAMMIAQVKEFVPPTWEIWLLSFSWSSPAITKWSNQQVEDVSLSVGLSHSVSMPLKSFFSKYFVFHDTVPQAQFFFFLTQQTSSLMKCGKWNYKAIE